MKGARFCGARTMRRFWVVVGVAVLACGCQTMSGTEKGIAGGGLIGGTAGAIIGKQMGNTAGGALIGAGLGALAGGLTGNEIDKAEARSTAQVQAAQYQAARPPLTVSDVATLAQQHVSDDLILNQIHSTHSRYRLSAQDIMWLKQNGVSDTVIREMQNAR